MALGVYLVIGCLQSALAWRFPRFWLAIAAATQIFVVCFTATWSYGLVRSFAGHTMGLPVKLGVVLLVAVPAVYLITQILIFRKLTGLLGLRYESRRAVKAHAISDVAV